jgi:dienelactone hydrolase
MRNYTPYKNRREFLLGLFALIAQERPVRDAVRTEQDWRRARDKTLAGMQLVMGDLPTTTNSPVDVRRLEAEGLTGFTRFRVKYLSEPGDLVPAYLLIPKGLKRRAPAMLCLHQTTRIGKDEPAGIGGIPNLMYAKELAERGYICLAPDYPYLGENMFNPYQHGYASCSMKGVVNHRRAVDALASFPEVDPQRIGVIGHSLGGHNALFVAAFDQRIKAVVTSCGFTSFRKYYGGDLTGWAGERYMPRIATHYQKDPAKMPFDFPDLLSALAPRPVFINAPLHDANFEVSGVRDCVEEATAVYDRVFRAKDRLIAMYPDAKHDFPIEIRTAAYSFLDRWL